MDKLYCLKCMKEYGDPSEEQCECGCRTFLYGNVLVKEKGFVCVCDNPDALFCSNTHMDFTNKAVTMYRCNKCGRVVSTTYYRQAEEKMLWGDEDEEE